MGKRVARTRAGETWTESRYFGFIRSALRSAFNRYPPKYQAKKAACRPKKGHKRFEYQCADCKKWFPNNAVQVDHINPAGSLKTFEELPGFCERLFCEPEDLQVLCKPCHQVKTNKEREKRSG